MKSFWDRFVRWLDGKEGPAPEKIRVSFPQGNTDILLSCNQRRKLEEAMSKPTDWQNSTGVYTRETGFWNKSSTGGKKDELII